MNIYEFRDRIGREIVDYNEVKDALSGYAHPRGKISEWIRKGQLIRIKKGLYVFGKAIARGPFSIEVLANLIYGPSAISLNYALAYYGMIPEAVQAVTSITCKRDKKFTTPIGQFNYRYLTAEKYAVGIQLLMLDNSTNFLIATPEKALCDTVVFMAKESKIDSQDSLENFLLHDLRIDEMALREMNVSLIDEITSKYHNSRLRQFTKHYKNWRK